MVREFEKSSIFNRVESDVYRHHEQSNSFQKKFKKDVSCLEEESTKFGNPFESRDGELIHLISNDVSNEVAVRTLQTIEQKGEEGKRTFLVKLQTNQTSFNLIGSACFIKPRLEQSKVLLEKK